MDLKRFNEITAWQYITFPQSTALSKLAHLKEEITEVERALTYEETTEEIADCIILLFGAAKDVGMNYSEILDSIDRKMVKNRARKWGEPKANGVVNHIKEEYSASGMDTCTRCGFSYDRNADHNCCNSEMGLENYLKERAKYGNKS